jgi:hypothetical protein
MRRLTHACILLHWPVEERCVLEVSCFWMSNLCCCDQKKKWLAKNANDAKENLRVRAGLLVTVMSPVPGGMVGVFRVQGCGHHESATCQEIRFLILAVLEAPLKAQNTSGPGKPQPLAEFCSRRSRPSQSMSN